MSVLRNKIFNSAYESDIEAFEEALKEFAFKNFVDGFKSSAEGTNFEYPWNFGKEDVYSVLDAPTNTHTEATLIESLREQFEQGY